MMHYEFYESFLWRKRIGLPVPGTVQHIWIIIYLLLSLARVVPEYKLQQNMYTPKLHEIVILNRVKPKRPIRLFYRRVGYLHIFGFLVSFDALPSIFVRSALLRTLVEYHSINQILIL